MSQTVFECFGLTVSADLECPECELSAGLPDVVIARGRVPDTLGVAPVRRTMFEATPSAMLFDYGGIGRFLVEDGRRISYAPHRGCSEEVLRNVLLGSALGGAMLQRGMFVVHAAACASARGAVIIAGYSGRGKSTILASLLERGHSLVSDDIAAISNRGGTLVVHPGSSSIQINADSYCHIRPRAERPARRREFPKVVVTARDAWLRTPQPVVAAFTLSYGSSPDLQWAESAGQHRLAMILEHVYLRRVVEAAGLQARHFAVASAFANRVPVMAIARPRGFSHVGEVTDLIEGWL